MSITRISLRALLGVTTAIGMALPALAQTSAVPDRVGQIADVSGTVSYNGAGSNGQWVAATPNYPVVSGDSLFTQDNAGVALVLNASRLSLAPDTELQVTALDDNDFTATESQGEVFLHLTDLQPGQSFTLNTPRGSVSIDENGQYDIAAGNAGTPTTVAVLAGGAHVGQLRIPAGQEGYISGTGQVTAQLGGLQRDDFMDRAAAEMAPPPPPYAPPVVQQMTGVNELSNYGDWSQSPEYGAVWYPTVSVGWAPFHEGHWGYVAPWGWTWVDADPWGFAPFHYGRWIQLGGRWGWVPAAAYAGGGDYRPVYAPAVVGFFGIGAGVTITAAILASQDVGWVPLAPNEPFYPYYHADDEYVRRINRVDVRNYTQINMRQTVVINHYANRRAAVYVPADALVHGAQVQHYAHPVPENMFQQAHPVQGAGFDQALRPQITHRQAPAPHPTAFDQRRNVPPPVISHQPFQPGSMPMQHAPMPNEGNAHPGMPQVFHPGGPQPAYHPNGMQGWGHAPAQPDHPQAPHVIEPAAPAFRPGPEPAHPAPFHDNGQAPAYHPPAPQEGFQPRMQPQQFHPAPHPEGQPHPEGPQRPDDQPEHRPQ